MSEYTKNKVLRQFNKNKTIDQDSGPWAEYLACLLLRVKGYSILERNYRNKYGEIDIIASKNQCIVFVEVKYRYHQSLANYALSPKQQLRIARSASIYLLKHPQAKARFDLMLFNKYLIPTHLQGAWSLENFQHE